MPAHFSGNPKTEWLIDGVNNRTMRVLEDFFFEDSSGRRWVAPVGSRIDGASIPEALWSTVGSPYTGSYRRASVVHDVACNDSNIPREDSDRMFYEACIAGGCSRLQAKLLYAGVCIGTWASDFSLASVELDVETHANVRLPYQGSRADLELRAKFTLIALQLERAGDSFEEVSAIVSRELRHQQ